MSFACPRICAGHLVGLLLAFVALSLSSSLAAQANDPKFVGGSLFGNGLGFEFSCSAEAFRDADSMVQPMQDLKAAGYRADFEILRPAHGQELFVSARFNYHDPQIGSRQEGVRILQPQRLSTLLAANPGLLRDLAFDESQIKELFRAGKETYLNLPHSRDYPFVKHFRGVDNLPVTSFYQYVTFPLGIPVSAGHEVPVRIRLTQEPIQVKAGEPDNSIWTKIYEGSCTTRELDRDQFRERRTALHRDFANWAAKDSRTLARSFLAPGAALDSMALYSLRGEWLGGRISSGLGYAALALSGAELLRRLLTVLARNPTLAAIMLPPTHPGRLTIDIESLGLSVEEARSFFRAGWEGRRRACTENPSFQAFCTRLAQLDFELAVTKGEAF